MHLIPPKPPKRKWDIRFRNHDGCTRKVSGERDKAAAERLGHRIDMLVRAKAAGDPPPGELKAWIENMPQSLSERLIELGLLERQRVERNIPLIAHVDTFQKIVAARKTNTVEHATRQAAMVRWLINDIGATTLSQFTEDEVLVSAGKRDREVATRRHYMIAAKDFAKWMVRSKRAYENPLVHLSPPGQYSDPSIERVPLTVAQFQKLMAYLDTFERYPHQKSRWTAADRKMLYWTAVKSGYRQGELRSFRVRSLKLDINPALIGIKAGDAKNETKGAVPIPQKLAIALRQYVEGRDSDEPLFPFPATNHGIVEIYRKDLEGAGIRWDFGDDNPETIDFHTLRSTAITWWLEEDKLTPKRVQVLARLKTLALVGTYSRNFRLDEFGWLDDGPSP
ncbi:MAG: site-specific integrase [Tepidisphaeraceae bacterium]